MSMHDLTLLNVAGSFQKAENVNEQRNLFPQTGHATLNTFPTHRCKIELDLSKLTRAFFVAAIIEI